MDSKPTPTPWQVDEFSITDANDNQIAFCDLAGSPIEVDYANAYLIVTAVNYHERLKATLREMVHTREEALEQESKGCCCLRCEGASVAARALLRELDKEAADGTSSR